MKIKLSILLLIGLLGLGSCAARFTEVLPGTAVALSKGEALVFGKIIFTENNEEKVPYGLYTQSPFPVAFQIESGKNFVGPEVERNGSFYWIVPRGTYVVSSIKYNFSLPPQVAFQVPSEGGAIYLGTLMIDVEVRNLIVSHSVKKLNSITVMDEFEKAKETLKKRNPGFKNKIEKNLMVHDERIPMDRNLYTQNLISNILSPVESQPSVQVTPSSDTLKDKHPSPQEIKSEPQPVDMMQKSQVPPLGKSQGSPPVNTNTVTVSGTSANIRSGAGNNFSIVTTVKQGDELILLGEYGEWFNVRLENGQEGWIDNRFVK